MNNLTTLNIGLAVEGRRDNDPEQVIALLRQQFPGALRGHRVDMSETEQTVIARLQLGSNVELGYEFTGRIYKLATFFGQDCIAVKFGSRGYGALIGPGAKSWGRFNDEFFIDFE